eukprot:1616767-Prymnesium_polylepis.1
MSHELPLQGCGRAAARGPGSRGTYSIVQRDLLAHVLGPDVVARFRAAATLHARKARCPQGLRLNVHTQFSG